MSTIDQILSDFAAAWNAGERPDVGEFLARAPEADRDELATALETWLLVAPEPDYDEAVLADIAASPALVAALAAGAEAVQPWGARVRAVRERSGLAIEQVAERLTALLGLPSERDRTAAYLKQAEHDALDERRLSRRLVDALASALGADPDSLRPAWSPPPAAAQFFRTDAMPAPASVAARFDLLSRAAAAPAPEPLDDLDRLFLGGPDA